MLRISFPSSKNGEETGDAIFSVLAYMFHGSNRQDQNQDCNVSAILICKCSTELDMIHMEYIISVASQWEDALRMIAKHVDWRCTMSFLVQYFLLLCFLRFGCLFPTILKFAGKNDTFIVGLNVWIGYKMDIQIVVMLFFLHQFVELQHLDGATARCWLPGYWTEWEMFRDMVNEATSNNGNQTYLHILSLYRLLGKEKCQASNSYGYVRSSYT